MGAGDQHDDLDASLAMAQAALGVKNAAIGAPAPTTAANSLLCAARAVPLMLTHLLVAIHRCPCLVLHTHTHTHRYAHPGGQQPEAGE